MNVVKVNEIGFTPALELYIVRNLEGKFFKSIGYNHRGPSGGDPGNWVEDINKAKVYTKIGQARSRVTFFANAYPKYGIPEIIKLTVASGEILDERNRVMKAVEKKVKAVEKYAKEAHQRKVGQANEELKRSLTTLRNLGGEKHW